MKYMLIFEYDSKALFLMNSSTLKNEMNKIGFKCLNNIGNIFYTDDLINIINLKTNFKKSDFIYACLGYEIVSYIIVTFDSLNRINSSIKNNFNLIDNISYKLN